MKEELHELLVKLCRFHLSRDDLKLHVFLEHVIIASRNEKSILTLKFYFQLFAKITINIMVSISLLTGK